MPSMFVLIGNFTSKKGSDAGGDGGVDYPTLRDGFSSLAALIERHDKIKVCVRVCSFARCVYVLVRCVF